eukprot:m.655243 g.655243  ORF g.655243 m.655243 type:complete len:1237 (+) comp22696_c0_seq3:132-3842(+)
MVLSDKQIASGVTAIVGASDHATVAYKYTVPISKGKNTFDEPRAAVIHNLELFVIAANSSKPQKALHLFDILSIECDSEKCTLKTTSSGIFGPMFLPATDSTAFVSAINVELSSVPALSLDRLCYGHVGGVKVPALQNTVIGACGGYLASYRYACAYHGVVATRRAEVDAVTTRHAASECKEFNAESFGCLDTPDADAMVTALQWNTHYNTFIVRDLKMNPGTLDAVCLLARRTHCLHTLVLSRLGGVKSDFWFTLSAALRANNACPVATVDFSHNAIEDKGAFALAVAFSGMPLGAINLCNVGLGPKGAAAVAKACTHILDTLHTLRVGDNAIGADGIKEIAKLFKGSNNLTFLDVENTGCFSCDALELLSTQQCGQLERLLIGRNKFLNKRATRFQGSTKLSQFTSSAVALNELGLEESGIPDKMMEMVVNGLQATYVPSFTLRLRKCDLGSSSVTMLAGAVALVSSLSTLDLSDNEFSDRDLGMLLEALVDNQTVKALVLDKSLVKAKTRTAFVKACAKVLSSATSALTSLSVEECGLREDTATVLQACAHNTTLEALRVAGNHMGDAGCGALGALLACNTTLCHVSWDQNAVTNNGLLMVTAGLLQSPVSRRIDLPLLDVVQLMAKSPTETMAGVGSFQQAVLQAAQSRADAVSAPSAVPMRPKRPDSTSPTLSSARASKWSDRQSVASTVLKELGLADSDISTLASDRLSVTVDNPDAVCVPSLPIVAEGGAPEGASVTDTLDAVAITAPLNSPAHATKLRAKPKSGTRRLPTRKVVRSSGGPSTPTAPDTSERRPTLDLLGAGGGAGAESTVDASSVPAPAPMAPPRPKPSAAVLPPQAKPRPVSRVPDMSEDPGELVCDADGNPFVGWFVKKGRSKFDAAKYRFFEFYSRELRYYGKEEDGRGVDFKGAVEISQDSKVAATSTQLMITNPDRNWILTIGDKGLAVTTAAWRDRIVEISSTSAPSTSGGVFTKRKPPKKPPVATRPKSKTVEEGNSATPAAPPAPAPKKKDASTKPPPPPVPTSRPNSRPNSRPVSLVDDTPAVTAVLPPSADDTAAALSGDDAADTTTTTTDEGTADSAEAPSASGADSATAGDESDGNASGAECEEIHGFCDDAVEDETNGAASNGSDDSDADDDGATPTPADNATPTPTNPARPPPPTAKKAIPPPPASSAPARPAGAPKKPPPPSPLAKPTADGDAKPRPPPPTAKPVLKASSAEEDDVDDDPTDL